MNKNYHLMAENERGELSELQTLINSPLLPAKREAIRLAGELGKPVYIMTPVFIAPVSVVTPGVSGQAID